MRYVPTRTRPAGSYGLLRCSLLLACGRWRSVAMAQICIPRELRFASLLTGQVQLVVPVAGTGTGRTQRVALHSLPAGQYAYQLVVEGQLVAAPQKLLVNP